MLNNFKENKSYHIIYITGIFFAVMQFPWLSAAKEMCCFLGGFSWRFSQTAKENTHFLGSQLKPASKYAFYLADTISRQVKYSFLGGCILADKKISGRQGNSSLG